MGKAIQDVPVEMRPFFKEMDTVAYWHNYSEVFNDFLIMCINAFSYPGSPTEAARDQALKKYNPKELDGLRGMFRELILIQDKMIAGDGDWYDPFGSIYEAITSSYKASGMGQFFTPSHIVDLMTCLVAPGVAEPYSTVGEPACGSGRMILSCHAKQPLNFYHATDLDSMCFRMTALNMAMHNASGVVHHANTLTLDWYDAFIIDRVKIEGGYFPVIKPATKEEADNWFHGIQEYCRIMRGIPRRAEIPDSSIIAASELPESRADIPEVEELIETKVQTLPVTKSKKSKPGQIAFDFEF